MKFLTDTMLGRLARWLRILGYDAVYSRSGIDYTRIQKMAEQDRIILTRNTRLYKKAGDKHIVFIRDDYFKLQVRQVVKELDLSLDEKKFFTRCVECNEELLPLPKDKVERKIPDYVFQTQSTFHGCSKCRRIYWQGTHLLQMEKFIKFFREKGEEKCEL